MDGLFPVDVLSRWVHVGTAITLVGGSAFVRFVLMPAAAELPDEQHAALRERLQARWRRFVHAGIVLFLLSGFYNYVRAIPKHQGDALYHALIGTKILLALGVFFLASVLVGRSQRFAPLRDAAARWMMLLILLAAVIVAISGFVKVRGTPPPPTPAATAD